MASFGGERNAQDETLYLVSKVTQLADFRAVVTPILIEKDQIFLSSEALNALQLEVGNTLRYVPLKPQSNP